MKNNSLLQVFEKYGYDVERTRVTNKKSDGKKGKNSKGNWNKMYQLAKAYYGYYGNLEIPYTFKTKNGYEYDACGENLGSWLATQRNAYHGKGHCKITEEQIKLLEDIGMKFEMNAYETRWNRMYQLAKVYYDYYGDLEISQTFQTKNGYEDDVCGENLGRWITTQRNAYHGKGTYKITEEKIKMLEDIGMRFERNFNDVRWNRMYQLAKAYYDYYGNLKVPYTFRTKSGYEYDACGENLGTWITTQRRAYHKTGTYKITEERIRMLEDIGMRFETNFKDIQWNEMYQLAKAYYEYHGNLEVPQKFQTKNGYEYDEDGKKLGSWVANQRNSYYGKVMYNITEERIRMLEDIGMKWFRGNVDDKYQKELINEENNHRKQIEILNRVRSLLIEFEKHSDGVFTSKEDVDDINKALLKKLG